MEPFRFRDDKYIMPPGTLVDSLDHPFYQGFRSVDIAVFFEHRYAFFFWSKWFKVLKDKKLIDGRPPCLITLDWHQDLAWPTDTQKKWLDKLDLNSNLDVSVFTWSSLSHHNDEQIMAAAYLNLIGDIYVHCRQGNSHRWEDQKFIDKHGKPHLIKRYKTFDGLEKHLIEKNIPNVYFDIDLDFFVRDTPYSTGGKSVKKFSYIPDNEIKSMLHIERPLIQWIFQRLCGFSIAIEPEHTGGLMRSYKYLKMIDSLYFKPSLFTNCGSYWENNTNWKNF